MKGPTPSVQIYTIDPFNSDDVACPITSQELTTLIPGITQPGCPSPPDSSIACRQVTVDTSVVKDYSAITFTGTADSANFLASQNIFFKVSCPGNVAIIHPPNFNTPVTTYVLGVGTQLFTMDAFITDDSNCPVVSYQAMNLGNILNIL